jgi:hypothetical protein
MSRRMPKSPLESAPMPAATKQRTESIDIGANTALGNAATRHLMNGAGTKSLPPAIRARMEHSFGVDLKNVRIDDSHTGRQQADSLNAQAMVSDGNIQWSSTAPPVESQAAESLLAHELAHVVQQRQASTIENRVSSPGESSETAASAAAGQAMAGQTASVSGGGAVAGAQRQPKPTGPQAPTSKEVSPEVSVQLLTTYLQKVAQTDPPQDIKKAKVVRDTLKRMLLASGPGNYGLDVDKFVESGDTSNDPAKMAQQFISKVRGLTPQALEILLKAKTIDDQPSLPSRVGGLVKKSGAGGPEQQQKVPGDVSPEDKSQQAAQTMAAQRGTTLPTTYGPVKVDLFQLWRIGKGLPQAVNPKAVKSAPPQSEVYPSVTAAIAKLPKGALIPAEEKAKGDPDNWADTATFAEDLARRMDVAQKSGQTELTVNLGEQYEQVKSKEALRDAVEDIIQKLRDALPHHAADVKYVIVKLGKYTLTRGMVQTQ